VVFMGNGILSRRMRDSSPRFRSTHVYATQQGIHFLIDFDIDHEGREMCPQREVHFPQPLSMSSHSWEVIESRFPVFPLYNANPSSS
jgi:hypothetical protein